MSGRTLRPRRAREAREDDEEEDDDDETDAVRPVRRRPDLNFFNAQTNEEIEARISGLNLGDECKYIYKVARIVVRKAEESGQHECSARLLCKMAHDVRQGRHVLTKLDPICLQECLLARAWTDLVPLSDQVISFDKAYGVDYKDYLLYTYYAGLLHIHRRQWKAAQSQLEECVGAPLAHNEHNVTSKIQLEAYKKLILLQLILDVPRRPPSWTAPSLTKASTSDCAPYLALSKAFDSEEAFFKLINQKKTIFTNDANFGLIEEAVATSLRRKIRAQLKAFRTVTVEELASLVKRDTQTVAQELLGLIEGREINAVVDENGMIHISDNKKQLDSVFIKDLTAHHYRMKSLQQEVRALNDQLAVDPAYLKKTLNTASLASFRSKDGPPEMMLNERLDEEMPDEGSEMFA